MADIRCPMCGKSNPDNLEICQFCQARLKPARSSETGGPAASSLFENLAASGDEEIPEWLRDLRPQGSSPSPAGEPEESSPEWLSTEKPPSPTAPAATPAFSDEGLDWLSGFRGEPDAAQSAEEVAGSPGAASLQDNEQAETSSGWWSPEETSGDAQPSPDSAESQDWLSGMRSATGPEAELTSSAGEPAAPSANPLDEEPDWLQKVRARAQEDAGSDETFDLEESFGSQPPFDSGQAGSLAANPVQEPSDIEFPDWMAQFSGSEEGTEATPQDWFLNEESDALSAASSPVGSPANISSDHPAELKPQDNDADWEAWLAADKSQPQSAATGGAVSSAFLLDDAEAGATGTETGSPSETEDRTTDQLAAALGAAAFAASRLPEWLSSEKPAGTAPQDADATSANLPTGIQAQDAQTTTSEEAPETIAPWVSGLLAGQYLAKDSAAEEPAQAGQEEEIPVNAGTPEEAFNNSDLDWLHELETILPEQEGEASGPAEVAYLPGEVGDEENAVASDEVFNADLPAWLAGAALAGHSFEAASSQESISEAAAGNEFSGSDEAAPGGLEEPAASPGEVPGLQPAELPGWLEAMRPGLEVAALGAAAAGTAGGTPPNLAKPGGENMASGTELGGEAHVESAGPLAGLSSLLPAEPDVTQSRKPAAYQLKLKISDAQKAHAEMLEQMVKTEGETAPLPRRRTISSQNVLRIAIFFILLVPVLWALIIGTPQAPLPDFTTEIVATSQLVQALPAGAPVLVAVDYEPGFVGELDAVSGALLDHLMLKGAFLTLVSTTQTGPVQAERLLSGVSAQQGHQYNAPEQYVNLGFIPGGATGLLSFVESPQHTLPLTMDGDRAWQSGPLANIQSLKDFAMVVVMTGSPETAQSWIQQVQPSLGATPLVLVTSAQAEPMVLPYAGAGSAQVQGLLSGLSGAAAYEHLMGRTGQASAYWTAFSYGLLVAAALILLGGILNAVPAWMARRKEDAGGEA